MAHQQNIYLLSGAAQNSVAVKSIPLTGVTTSDIDRWFGDGAGAGKADPDSLWQIVWVLHRCVTLRALAVANMPREIVDDNGRVVAAANMPVQPVDDKGNPIPHDSELPFEIDLSDLLWRTEASLSLLGQAYWHKERVRRLLKGVRWLDPKTIKPVISRTSGLAGFERNISGFKPIPIPLEDMMWIWLPGLREAKPGPAPGQAAARQADVLHNMDTFIEKFFERGAMPTTLVMTDKLVGNEEERRKIKSYLQRALTGIGNAFGLEILNSAFKFETLTPPLKSMVIPEITDDKAKQVAVAMGVPLSIVFSDAANYAVSQTDDVHYYTKTIEPQINFVQPKINKRLLRPMGLHLRFRPDKLEVYQKLEVEKVTAYSLLFDRKVITEDELRESAGLQPRALEEKPTITVTAGVDEGLEDEGAEETGVAAAKRADAAAKRADAAAQAKGDDLAKWQRKVIKSLKSGRDPAAVEFESAALTAWEMAYIRKGLRNAQVAEEVKAAFVAPFRS